MNADSPSRSSGSATTGRTSGALVAVCAYAVVVTGLLLGLGGLPTAVRVPLAIPLLLFAPGYAVVTALFPVGGESDDPEPLPTDERLTLAVVTSIALVPVVALVANVVTGVSAGPVLVGTTLVTLVASGVAVLRLPGQGVRPRWRGIGIDRGDVGPGAVPTDAVTVVAVTATVLLLVATVAVPFVGGANEPRTEFYLADGPIGGGADGDTAQSIPEGRTGAYDVGIEHHAGEQRRYSVVVQLDPAGDDRSARELHRASTVVAPDEVATVAYGGAAVEGTATLRFLLYRGDAPADPDPGTAHRTLELTIDAGAE